MKKCLVTGGAGFIGSNLVERLIGDGVQVRVLDNLTTGFLENLKPFLGDIDFKQGDVRDLDTLQKLWLEWRWCFTRRQWSQYLNP